MRTERVGWPATVAVAVLLFVAVYSRLQRLSVAAMAVVAIVGALVASWALDIVVSVLAYYRNGTQPRSVGEVLRRHTRLRTPATATIARNVLVAAAAVVVVSATLGTGIGAVDQATPSVSGNVSTSGVLPAGDADDGLNETAIERAVHQRINEVRADHGLSKVGYSDRLSTSAREHSGRMADRGELDHSDLDAQYACGYTGENIAYTYASADIATENGTVNYYGNETEIAHGLVRQWMNSVQHRQNILDPKFSAEGIGITTAQTPEGERVYATQALCG
jgi:uncharacterized protein YkwD